jgi:hypothetical protein
MGPETCGAGSLQVRGPEGMDPRGARGPWVLSPPGPWGFRAGVIQGRGPIELEPSGTRATWNRRDMALKVRGAVVTWSRRSPGPNHSRTVGLAVDRPVCLAELLHSLAGRADNIGGDGGGIGQRPSGLRGAGRAEWRCRSP